MIALWAGQAAGLADGAPPAARIVEEVVAEAAATLRELAGPLAERG
jgi:NAD(P)H-dependent flavin oxidoreductase YrpB (nitropropane dioxygenase family)